MKDQPSKRTVSTNNDGCEHLASKPNDVIGLSDVERSEETGMRKRNWNSMNGTEVSTEAAAQSKQSWAENTKLLESRGHQSSVSRVVEDGLISMEVNRNSFGLTVNNTSMGVASYGAMTSTSSLFQDVGSVCISTNDETKLETKNAVEILQIFVSKRFSEVLVPPGSKFMLDTLKYLLRSPEDDEISRTRCSFLQLLSNCLTKWSQDYKGADILFKSTTAELSKVSELEAGLAA